jgi:hypothetical protein
MAAQQIAITKIEGRKPLIPVATGKASIPPPMHVPATRNIAEIIFPFLTLFSNFSPLFNMSKREFIKETKWQKDTNPYKNRLV